MGGGEWEALRGNRGNGGVKAQSPRQLVASACGGWSGRGAGGWRVAGEARAQGGALPRPEPASLRFCPLRYWEDFHSCTVTALTDCQDGAKDLWDKLRKESKNLNFQGSMFQLCGSGSAAAGLPLPAPAVLLAALSAALAAWLL